MRAVSVEARIAARGLWFARFAFSQLRTAVDLDTVLRWHAYLAGDLAVACSVNTRAMWEGEWKSVKRYNRADHTDINEANCILQYNANLPGTNLGSETAEERGQTDIEGVTND